MPYVGLHSYNGESWRDFDAGLRVGGLLGARLSELASLNGQLNLDFMNPNEVMGVDINATIASVTIAPLLHMRAAPNVELVLGPKLGGFYYSLDASTGSLRLDGSARGWVAGAQAGMFFAVNPSAFVGVLFSYTHLDSTHSCFRQTGTSEICTDDPDGDNPEVIGVTLSALF